MTVTKEMIEAGLRITLSSVNMPAGECLHETDVREILEAALSSRSAEAGKPVEEPPMSTVAIARRAGDEAYKRWRGTDTCLDGMNYIAFHIVRALSALSTPADIEPVAWLHPTANWSHVDYDRVRMHCGNDGPLPIPLYAAPVADSEPVSVPEGWALRHDNFKRWCIFGPDDRWYMQPVGMITADEARIVCERASALAAAPQPNPSTVDARAETVTLTRMQIDGMLRAAYPFSTKDERDGILASALVSEGKKP
ncbi:hypothetical protein [Ensifer adhaerens]|uniref:hypothetical protein n=1 Tax=Ensifer adhaerens TaxID=106592 RepID=UPI000DC24C0A|nr:hypothetical protein [Ensifer adhaerens]RAS13503.1 hypothetical protein DEU52_106101 [Ensifer adhaerens]